MFHLQLSQTEKITLMLAFFMSSLTSYGQVSVDTVAIKTELDAILIRDQKTRRHGDSTAYMPFIDSCNLAQVERIVATYGWPGISFVGRKGNQTVFLVIQHADLPVQEKYFPLLKKSVEAGESLAADLALLEDRILMRQGKKQRYGSQIIMNDKGGQEFYPIEDEINVNQRRFRVGLDPIEVYALYFGIYYEPPGK